MKLLFLLIFLSALDANMLKVSQKVDAKILESQHEKKHKLLENGIWVIAWSKESTSIANDYFTKHPMPKNINFIVDTSAIPSGIFSLFVHPRMKKFSHTILFSFDTNYNLSLPYKQNSLSILYIEDAKIKKIVFVETPSELEESLK